MNVEDYVIKINNFADNSVVCYSVILLKGEVKANKNWGNNSNIRLQVKNENYNYDTESALFSNKFKCLVSLKLGTNDVNIKYCSASISISLKFQPVVTDHFVVPIYIICKNHDGKFQSPNEDNTVDSACQRIAVSTKLIQCLIAEKFYEVGLARKTFQLENDLNPNVPACRVFYSSLDVESARSMQQEELWASFGRELMNSQYGSDKCKFLAFISCTRYRPDRYHESLSTHADIVGITEAYAALGGGGLALFGSACLYTWPTTLQHVVTCFQNTSVVDKTLLMDDSCYRGTYGGCFATTLGAVCHELCHTFDLGHTSHGIMGRGFDQINQEFTFTAYALVNDSKVQKILPPEKQHCTVPFTRTIIVTQSILPLSNKLNVRAMRPTSNEINVKLKDGVHWTRSCSLLLYFHRWLNSGGEKEQTLKYNYEKKILNSSRDICVVEIRDNISEIVIQWWDLTDKPTKEFAIDQLNDNSQQVLVAEDSAGNILKISL